MRWWLPCRQWMACCPGRWSNNTATAERRGAGCRRGEPHGPYVYLQVAGRLLYVPSGLVEVVHAYVEGSQRLRGVLAEISAINLELLARRELG
jgi:hypothetical protein